MANLGAQAGSGLDASDITTGTLGNTVQDNITRLGAVTTGTFSGTLSSSATFPAGSVLNVLQAINSTEISKSDTNAFDIVTVDITPKSTSNKILVFGEVMGVQRGTGATARLDVILTRDTTDIHTAGANFYTLDAQDFRHGGFAISKLDSPSSTSQITYKLRGKYSGHSSPSYVNKDGNSGNSTITVMEVAG